MKTHIFLCLVFLAICLVLAHGKSTNSARKGLTEQSKRNGNGLHSQRKHKFEHSFGTRNGSADLEVNKRVSQRARYIVHNSDWASLATSRNDEIPGYPYNTIKSISDGPDGESTGVPYFLMSTDEFSALDMAKDSRASLSLSLDQSGYCREHNYDPEGSDCAKVTIVGSLERLREESEEYEFGYNAMISRHPDIKNWAKNLEYFVAKLKVEDVVLAYETRVQCSPLPIYLSVEPKF